MIDKKDILKLKKVTHARIIDCRKALQESEGDFEQAILWLRKKGEKIAAKRVGRVTTQGGVFARVNAEKSFGVMFTLGCETDFVARNELFVRLGEELLTLGLEHRCTSLEEFLKLSTKEGTVQELIMQAVATIGENINITAYATLAGEFVSMYIHTGARIGSMVSLSGGVPSDKLMELGKHMAMQVVVSDPIAIDREGIPADVLMREKLLIEDSLKKEDKPEMIKAKIGEGRMKKFVNEVTLLPSTFIKDSTKSVEEHLKSINPEICVTGFKRFQIGS